MSVSGRKDERSVTVVRTLVNAGKEGARRTTIKMAWIQMGLDVMATTRTAATEMVTTVTAMTKMDAYVNNLLSTHT